MTTLEGEVIVTVRDRDSYETYRQLLIKAGVSEKEADRLIDAQLEEDRHIVNGDCPKCGNRLTRKLDACQAGPTSVSGKWFNYRCDCGFLLDRVE